MEGFGNDRERGIASGFPPSLRQTRECQFIKDRRDFPVPPFDPSIYSGLRTGSATFGDDNITPTLIFPRQGGGKTLIPSPLGGRLGWGGYFYPPSKRAGPAAMNSSIYKYLPTGKSQLSKDNFTLSHPSPFFNKGEG